MTTYLITGTSRGLGRELLRQLHARGDKVLAAARKQPADADVSRQAARFVTLDVADPASIERAAKELAGSPIDVLINNAGVYDNDTTIEQVTADIFARVFATNATGPALVTKAFLPHLRAGSKKTIINITSGLGSLATIGPGFPHAYCASKAALNMISVRTAQDLKNEGFTVVTVNPGWVRTDMGGPNADLAPEDAIRTLIGTMDKLSPARTGAFLNYDGATIPW